MGAIGAGTDHFGTARPTGKPSEFTLNDFLSKCAGQHIALIPAFRRPCPHYSV
jgi:hypothetical protein